MPRTRTAESDDNSVSNILKTAKLFCKVIAPFCISNSNVLFIFKK